MLKWNLLRPAVGMLALAIVLSLFVLPSVASAQEQPRRGGTLVVGLFGDPPHLNPATSSDLSMFAVGAQVFNPLVRVDRDLKVQPELAERWDISKDGLTYTFYLRKNVKWHDGRPFTSADVKYGLMEVNQKYQGAAATALAMVQSVDAPDPYTVVFKLKNTFSPFFPWSVAAPYAQIVPKHLYEGTDPNKNDYNFKPVGTGPFVFKEWVKGSHITLERNPDYFKPGQPYLDRLVFKIIPDNAARVMALEKGEVDHLNYFTLPASAIKELSKKQDIEVEIDRTRSSYGTVLAFFNLRNPPLKTKEVRHAIAYAVDRKVLVEKSLDGLGDPGSSPVSSHQTRFYNSNVPRYTFDPARADQLLDQAGFPRKADGTRFSIRLSFQRGGEAGALDSAADIVREQLRAVGIRLDLQPMDGAARVETAHVKWDFDLTLASFATGPDPSIGIARLYTTENIKPLPARNLMGYSNPRVDRLFEQAESEIDEGKRLAMYHEAQVLMVEDLPALWLWDKFSPVAQRRIVRGGLPPGSSHFENFDHVWLATVVTAPTSTPTVLMVAGLVIVVAAAGGLLVVRRLRSA